MKRLRAALAGDHPLDATVVCERVAPGHESKSTISSAPETPQEKTMARQSAIPITDEMIVPPADELHGATMRSKAQ